jgi:cysteinyl-tRNA synthetase
MGKSLGNFITLEEFFTGSHKLLEKAWSPMTIRFFILQAHYRSTIDFSNEALQAAEKGLTRLMDALQQIEKITPAANTSFDIEKFREKCYAALNDDLNSYILIAHLFEGARIINSAVAGKETFSWEDLDALNKLMHLFTEDILGLKYENKSTAGNSEILTGVMDLLLSVRQQAKKSKNFETADRIRDGLKQLGIEVRDGKDGAEWEVK